MILNYRSKINPKIIYGNIEDGKNVLFIGIADDDIFAVLSKLNSKIDKIISTSVEDILNDIQKTKTVYDYLILNLEASKIVKLEKLLNTIFVSSIKTFIRVRNPESFIMKKKISKKLQINEIIKAKNLKILKRFYCVKNKIYNSFIMRFFSYYTVYIVKSNIDIKS